MKPSTPEDYHASFLFCFPPHFVYVLQGRDLVIFEGSLHHILDSGHGEPLSISIYTYTGIVARVSGSQGSLQEYGPLRKPPGGSSFSEVLALRCRLTSNCPSQGSTLTSVLIPINHPRRYV